MDSMTTKEVSRLVDWLKAQGMTAEQACECLKYIAGESEPVTA